MATNGSSAVCSDLNHNLKNISPWDHEDTDTRMLLYVRDALLNESHTKQLVTFSPFPFLQLHSSGGLKELAGL